MDLLDVYEYLSLRFPVTVFLGDGWGGEKSYGSHTEVDRCAAAAGRDVWWFQSEVGSYPQFYFLCDLRHPLTLQHPGGSKN